MSMIIQSLSIDIHKSANRVFLALNCVQVLKKLIKRITNYLGRASLLFCSLKKREEPRQNPQNVFEKSTNRNYSERENANVCFLLKLWIYRFGPFRFSEKLFVSA